MNISLFFTTALAVNFTVHFQRSMETHQDLFILSKGDNCAYFYRRNNTATLHILEDNHTIIYQKDLDMDGWSFTWPNMLNNNSMELIKGNGTIHLREVFYDSLVFIDPVIEGIPVNSQRHEFNMNDLYYLLFLLPIIILSPMLRELNVKFSSFIDRNRNRMEGIVPVPL